MASSKACPDEPGLLVWATEGESGSASHDHLADCPDCRREVDRLRAELAYLRASHSLMPGRDWPVRPVEGT